MKGYKTTLKAGFTAGLRPEGVTSRNSGLFTICRNMRVTKAGSEGYVPNIQDILSPAFPFVDSVTAEPIVITRSWPFPQLFLTDVGLFIGAKEGLYWISDPWTTSELYSFGTGAVTWPWICIPINIYPAFTSGSVFVYYDVDAAAYVKVT